MWSQSAIAGMQRQISRGRSWVAKMAHPSPFVHLKVCETRNQHIKCPKTWIDLYVWLSCIKFLDIFQYLRYILGTVEAFSSLDCEVVFYPSYGSSTTTQFALHVEGGNQPKLLCQAQVQITLINNYSPKARWILVISIITKVIIANSARWLVAHEVNITR